MKEAEILQESLKKRDFKVEFGGLKKDIGSVTLDQWEQLPEAPDLAKVSRKKRNQEFQRYTPVPDSVLAAASMESKLATSIDPALEEMGAQVDTQVTERGQMLSMQLEKAGTVTSLGGSSVNREGYMTDLMSIKVNSETEISDLKKARALLKSVIISNPKQASGWVAAARVEELDGKIAEARAILHRACLAFPEDEDIWLEAARLSEPSQTRFLLAKGIKQMPKSKKLWL